MSTVALPRHPSRAMTALYAVLALGRPIVGLIQRRRRSGKDARLLQTLPDHMLADIGLEKMEIMSGSGGQRETWVIPHRYR